MLAAFGFIITGIFFALFAATFERMVIGRTKLPLFQFSNAYYCLALALLTWGAASASGDPMLLRFSVIVGDVLLLAGTIFMASIIVPSKYYSDFWFGSVAIAAFLIAMRAVVLPPDPFMQHGLLIFNSPKSVMLTICLGLSLIWLPVNLYVAKTITHTVKQDSLNMLFTIVYTAATISALLFITARTPFLIISSFVALSVSFIMLLSSNLLIQSLLKDKKYGK